MAILAGHMTKLQAVNDMLFSIQERPVSTLESGLPSASQAEDILDRESRRIQMYGWHANTLYNFEIAKNVANQFALPDNTLKVDTVDPRGTRLTQSVGYSAFVDASMRRAGDDTKWLLWDNMNNTEVWSDETTLTVELVQLLDFANLPVGLQMYVWTSAAHRFQQGAVGSAALNQFTEQDVIQAQADAFNEDMENRDANMISDNPHTAAIARRFNPMSGR